MGVVGVAPASAAVQFNPGPGANNHGYQVSSGRADFNCALSQASAFAASHPSAGYFSHLETMTSAPRERMRPQRCRGRVDQAAVGLGRRLRRRGGSRLEMVAGPERGQIIQMNIACSSRQ